jgi:hypothetical protein
MSVMRTLIYSWSSLDPLSMIQADLAPYQVRHIRACQSLPHPLASTPPLFMAKIHSLDQHAFERQSPIASKL